MVGAVFTRIPKCLCKTAGQEAAVAKGLEYNEERKEVKKGVVGRKENNRSEKPSRNLTCLRK